MTAPTNLLFYVGTYTRRAEPNVSYQGRGEGIYRYRLELATGQCTYLGLQPNVVNPSYMAIHPTQRYLYTVNQAVVLNGVPGGGVSAFAIDQEMGALTFLNQQAAQGAGPCYVSIDQSGRCVLVASYRSGSVAVLPIQADGSLGQASDAIQHQGSSINPQRQEGPHAHSIVLDPTNRLAVVPDLGMDKVMIYQLDPAQGKLTANSQPWVEAKLGAGPRHFIFHPNERYAYVINELDSTIVTLAYNAPQQTLQPLQTISTLPADFSGQSHCADIHLSPSGRFLYGSNRGHDSIAIFSVAAETGLLTAIGHESTQGESPRNFAIDPTGAYLLAANQNSDSVVIFKRDEHTGQLEPTGTIIEVPSPVCVKFLQP